MAAVRGRAPELAGRIGGTWRIEIADPAGPHHPIRVAIMSRLPLTGPRQTLAFLPGLHKIQTEDDGHPGAKDPPTDLLSRRVRADAARGIPDRRPGQAGAHLPADPRRPPH